MKFDNNRLKKSDLAEITGIPARTILDWTQKGYLIPAVRRLGQGKISYYSPANAVQAKVLEMLSRYKMPMKNFSYLFNSNKSHLDFFDPFKWQKNLTSEDIKNLNKVIYHLVIVDDCRKLSIGLSTQSKIKDMTVILAYSKNIIPEEIYYGDYKMLFIINLKNIILEIKAALMQN